MLALLIVGGAASAEPAVVALEQGGAVACSGSVVAPHAVLTAAHCLTDPRPITIEGRTVVARIAIPTFEPATLAHDLALAIVASPFTIAPLALGMPTGGEIQLVGFGEPMPNVQRQGIATITALETLQILSAGPAFTCDGDSGGPALANGAIVGVTSSGDCATVSRHARVDTAFVEETIAKTAAGAAIAGDRCWYDANCADDACVVALDEPKLAFCAPACTTTCPDDLACVDGLCRHPLPSPGAEGSACEAASDCADNPCLARDGDDGAICARRCFSDLPGFTCPAGTACQRADDGGEACFAPPSDGGCSAATSPGWLALLWLAQLLRGRGKP